jgi:hypothetical protein
MADRIDLYMAVKILDPETFQQNRKFRNPTSSIQEQRKI